MRPLLGSSRSYEREDQQADNPGESMADKQHHVVLRCRPYDTFAQSPSVKTGDESTVRAVSGAAP